MDVMDNGKNKPATEPLIPKHGGYRKLKSFQIAQLVYDLTVRFCDLYIGKKSRTHDQMVQAARSGVQNIAEGSQASGTSRKTELKLTNVARASLEELKLDYEDFLRQKSFAMWTTDDPLRQALIDRRCTTADEVAKWLREVHDGLNGREKQNGQSGQLENREVGVKDHTTQTSQSIQSKLSTQSTKSIVSTPTQPATYAELAANAALVLIGVACSLLDRQIKAQANAFTQEGGFTERLYNTRQKQRQKPS